MRLDSDDWLDLMPRMILTFERNKISLVFPDYYEVDKNGKIQAN